MRNDYQDYDGASIIDTDDQPTSFEKYFQNKPGISLSSKVALLRMYAVRNSHTADAAD